MKNMVYQVNELLGVLLVNILSDLCRHLLHVTLRRCHIRLLLISTVAHVLIICSFLLLVYIVH